MKVHSALGPGPLDGAYEFCLAHELERRGLTIGKQVSIPIRYQGLATENGYRIDLLVDNRVVVELKAIEALLPVHRAQLLSYLRLGGFRLGYLVNFNVLHMREGIARLVNGR
jgi:GxxExxY protein